MRYLLLLSLALDSCAGSQPPRVNPPTSAVQAELPELKPAASSAKADSGNTGVKLPEPARRFFGLLPPKKEPEKSFEGFPGRKFRNKGTLIIQQGTGHTAATATKPGTMATGTEANAVDAGKAKAPVQTGAGNAATDNTKASQRQGSAATGAGSSASNESKKGGTPWWVFALVGVLGGAGG